ncbi:MAG: GntR family transcriptional regulator, partial [Pseudomonadota bacterium]|nr:GntR family transcriptional regulator [Pseudomonadota bacterium]
MQKKTYKARYSEISDILVSQITSGHYELGQQLPSEQAMSESFNVSRFTIRAALREIEKMGMISRHRRRGTILLSDKPVELIVQEIKGFEELFQYPQDTVLHMTKSSSMEADISLANFLKTTPGTDWTRL